VSLRRGARTAFTGRVRRLATRAGLDVRRLRPDASHTARRMRLLRDEGVDLVLDVGANAGQYARELRIGGYGGRIWSFEPLGWPYYELSRRAAGDAGWDVTQTALGDHDGWETMYVSADTQSSSVLEMTDRHTAALADSRPVASQRVRVTTLDAIAGEAVAASARPYLKVDVQGYEERVMAGAAAVLDRVRGLEIELSLVELYEGQALIGAMLSRLDELGFACVGLEPEFVDPSTGHVLQMDGLFVRRTA
jgi:FkbM family methyltransferase